MTQIRRLATHAGPGRTLVTRWLPTADRSTAWGDYFRAWPFADVPASHPLYELVDEARELSAHPTIDEPTFGKWGPHLTEIAAPHPHPLPTAVWTASCPIPPPLAAPSAA